MVIERYAGRVALVTGASAGIGAAIVQALLKEGLVVVGLARRVDKVEALKIPGAPGKLHALKGDVSKEEDILATFKWIKDNLGGVDVLINNAGVFGENGLVNADTSEWRRIVEVNILGLSICTREAVKSMQARGVDDGFIIHISSIEGHLLPSHSSFSFYASSKWAVTALTEGIRKELVERKTNIRNTTISPGLVKTEILDNLKVFPAEEIYASKPFLLSEDIAEAVVFVLSQPLRVQIHDMIIQPTGTQRISSMVDNN